MQACLTSSNLIARADACADLFTLSPLGGYFLAVAALLIAARFAARLI